MAINYSWRIEDMQWDNSTGMVVSVNAAYVGTFNGMVGSATTTITEAQTNSGNWINNPSVENKESNYRIQVDYAF